MKSKEIIKQAKQRFKELEHKQFEWRSFYNGYLEGQAKQLIITDVVGQSELLCAVCKGTGLTNERWDKKCEGCFGEGIE